MTGAIRWASGCIRSEFGPRLPPAGRTGGRWPNYPENEIGPLTSAQGLGSFRSTLTTTTICPGSRE